MEWGYGEVDFDRALSAGVVTYRQAVNTNNLIIRWRNFKEDPDWGNILRSQLVKIQFRSKSTRK